MGRGQQLWALWDGRGWGVLGSGTPFEMYPSLAFESVNGSIWREVHHHEPVLSLSSKRIVLKAQGELLVVVGFPTESSLP